MIIPILAKFATAIAIDNMYLDFPISTLINIFGCLIPILIIIIKRSNDYCKKMDMNTILRAIMQSLFAQGVSEFSTWAIKFIPFVGSILSIMSDLPIIGPFISSFIWSFAFAGTYIVLNMINADLEESFCNVEYLTYIDIIMGSSGIVATLIINFMDLFMDFLGL